jgi:hypothetical protein
MDFFWLSTKNTPDHGTKSDPKRTFEPCLQKKNFSPKINQDRVASNVFDPKMIFMKIDCVFRFMEKIWVILSLF